MIASNSTAGAAGFSGRRLEPLPHNRYSHWIDRLLERCGGTIAWIWLVLVAVVVINVFSRFVLRQGHVQLEELSWHLYALGFLLGLSYAFQQDAHVRVDLFFERFSLKTRAVIDLTWLTLLLIPFLVILILDLLPYAYTAYSIPRAPAPAELGWLETFRHWLDQGERSQAPSGLPARWILKFVLLGAFLLLLLGALSRLLRCLTCLLCWPRPLASPTAEETLPWT